MRPRRLLPWSILVAPLMAGGCASAPAGHASTRAAYPGTLVPAKAIPGGSFLWRQKVTGVHGERRFSFEAAVQRKGATLTVLGLTPFGSKAFVLVQEGSRVTFTKFVPDELPFPPDSILLDVHRAFFIGLGPAEALADGARDGVRDGEREGEEIVETWRDGRLVERRFRRLDDQPPGEIVVAYGEGMRGVEPPPLVTLDNGWFGYRLTVETVEQRALD